VEHGQLQLEASTWSMHSRIEKAASQRLRMRQPDSRRLHIVQPAQGSR
jgi:cell division protein FtsL